MQTVLDISIHSKSFYRSELSPINLQTVYQDLIKDFWHYIQHGYRYVIIYFVLTVVAIF